MEAAHVVSRSQRGRDCLSNAICVCPVHHWAFDRGLITIDEELSVRVSSEVSVFGVDSTFLDKLEGQKARFPDDFPVPSIALGWHRRNIFRE